MSREDDLPRNTGYRLIEAHTLILHTIPDCLDHRKSAVAFVHMNNAGRNSHRFQGAKTAHAKE
jgi:hypothetical protein